MPECIYPLEHACHMWLKETMSNAYTGERDCIYETGERDRMMRYMYMGERDHALCVCRLKETMRIHTPRLCALIYLTSIYHDTYSYVYTLTNVRVRYLYTDRHSYISHVM